MKIKSETIGIYEVRLTQQSETARYGAGVYVVRRLTNGRKREEKSFLNRANAQAQFDFEVKFCRELTANE